MSSHMAEVVYTALWLVYMRHSRALLLWPPYTINLSLTLSLYLWYYNCYTQY